MREDEIKIRVGEKQDLPHVFELIKELALFEKAPEEVENSVSMMEKDGFGDHPVFGFIVAEKANQIIGTSIYYYRYSTWKGKRLYMEDLIVNEHHRGHGIGTLLLDATIAYAKEQNCTGMNWQALDWNQPALDFYEKYGTTFDDEWINCQLNF